MKNSHAASDKTPTPRTAPSEPAIALNQVQDRHLERLAVVYVRQSSAQQVFDHRESRARQYALSDHAATLGWPKDRVATSQPGELTTPKKRT